MAKSKAPVYYCKWCDEILKADCQFCSQPCKNIYMKTRNTPAESMIANYQETVDNLKQERYDIQAYCRHHYIEYKKTLCERDLPNIRMHVQLYGYIHNKNRDKAFKTLEKFRRHHQELIDGALFEGETYKIGLAGDDDDPACTLTGEESLRVDAILTKLSVQCFELMLEQTFK